MGKKKKKRTVKCENVTLHNASSLAKDTHGLGGRRARRHFWTSSVTAARQAMGTTKAAFTEPVPVLSTFYKLALLLLITPP